MKPVYRFFPMKEVEHKPEALKIPDVRSYSRLIVPRSTKKKRNLSEEKKGR